MELGGVMLGSGMILDIADGDHHPGAGRIRFLLQHIRDTRTRAGQLWVTLDGLERPDATTPWRPLRVEVRVDALKRCLALLT